MWSIDRLGRMDIMGLPGSGPLAQLAEQLTLNQQVTGSTPVRLTNHCKECFPTSLLGGFSCHHSKKEHLILIQPGSTIAHDLTAFLIDRQARQLSERSIEFYSDELRLLLDYLAAQSVKDMESVTATHLLQPLYYLQPPQFSR